MATSFELGVYRVCRLVPRGRVTTYKDVAEALNTKAYRAVGQALKKNPFHSVPCHRVVCSDESIGGFRGFHSGEKARLLGQEGVKVVHGKVQDFDRKYFNLES